MLFTDSSYLFNGYNDIHSSSCVYNYYQLGMEDTHSNMLLELLHQIIKDPCFSTLRYVLSLLSMSISICKVTGCMFVLIYIRI